MNEYYYFTIQLHHYFANKGINDHNLFYDEKEVRIPFREMILFEYNAPEIFKKYDILGFFIDIEIIPYRKSLLLNRSLSIFDVKPNKNKHYLAYFGNDEEYIEIGYLDNNIYTRGSLQNRIFYRLHGAELNLNTIIPDNAYEKMNINYEKIILKIKGQFDFNNVL